MNRHHHATSLIQSTEDLQPPSGPGAGWFVILLIGMTAVLAFAAGILFAFHLIGIGE